MRVFNEWAYIQNRYQYCGYEGPEEITNTFFRAIAERNCKIIFLKMILEPRTEATHLSRMVQVLTGLTRPLRGIFLSFHGLHKITFLFSTSV